MVLVRDVTHETFFVSRVNSWVTIMINCVKQGSEAARNIR